MDYVKDAFQKVKQDILDLHNEIEVLKLELGELSKFMFELRDLISSLKKEKEEMKKQERHSTDRFVFPTLSTHLSTEALLYKPLKAENKGFSIGNEGVPTDRQTDRQTDQQTQNLSLSHKNPIENAAEILSSLDSLKKEIRLKFKRLTEREWIIFSLIYQLDEEGEQIDYKLIAKRLNLTESSIRDYVGRLVQKGVPIIKTKLNNKQINLSISPNLKQIASLSTILQLRSL